MRSPGPGAQAGASAACGSDILEAAASSHAPGAAVGGAEDVGGAPPHAPHAAPAYEPAAGAYAEFASAYEFRGELPFGRLGLMTIGRLWPCGT